MPVLVAIEQVGVRVDTAALAALSRTLEREMQARSARIFELAGETFNINSPKQLGEILFEKLKLPVLQEDRQDERRVDRGRRARRTGADARAAAARPRLADHAEAEGHLRRRAARSW